MKLHITLLLSVPGCIIPL